MKLTILFEDKDLVAVDKPSGMLSIPDRWGKEKGKSMVEVLTKRLKQKIFIIHRLDRDTSGVILFAKTAEAHKTLSQQFENREVEKIYFGLCHGIITKDQGKIDKPLAKCNRKPGTMIVDKRKGKEALTLVEVTHRFEDYSFLKLMPKTGRTHQIRVHLASIGHPLVCDPLYGLTEDDIYLSKIKKRYKKKGPDEEEKPLLNQLALHAGSLKFKHPAKEEAVTVEAPLRKNLKAIKTQLEKFSDPL